MLHCPKCDAIFEAHEDAHVETTCPRCGRVVSKGAPIGSLSRGVGEDNSAASESGSHFLFTNAPRAGGVSLAGRPGILRWTKNVAVRLVASSCPACGRSVGKRLSWCPYCGRPLQKSSVPAAAEWVRRLRKILVATTVFIGIPTAVIVFVLVVCAPEGNDVGVNAPRALPAARDATTRPGEKPEVARVDPIAPKRGPLSALRSLRKWLRGPERGNGDVPAKSPLEGSGHALGKSRVPTAAAEKGDSTKLEQNR